ncbi:MAG TPA: dienelactone hydrolase family protein [Pyrinomonadaceae bacterium]|nr:dienelactone hydrolase family protein [Pyrinomonadaceae bacterium]
MSCDLEAQQPNAAYGVPPVQALDDKNVIHGRVSFKSGTEDLDGYLARPNKKGRFPIVVIVAGNPPYEEYVRNMTAMFAQIGFVGIAPNIYSVQRNATTLEQLRKILAEKITDAKIFGDIRSSISYAKEQGFGKSNHVAVTGFCFGGRCALMFAANYPNAVRAVVPFYGNLKTPAFAGRELDPIDVVARIRVPVLGHYAENDPEIPLAQLRDFEALVKKNNSNSQIFTYAGARHGFFAHTQPTYDADVSKIAWERTTVFLRKHLSH